jgi:hypothetical protein
MRYGPEYKRVEEAAKGQAARKDQDGRNEPFSMSKMKHTGHQGRGADPPIQGLFLTTSDAEEVATHWAAIEPAARAYQADLRRVTWTPGLVAAVIPEALRRDTRSWLVLHRPDRDQELLIIPYPDATVMENVTTVGGLGQHASLTMEEIRGAGDRPWFADWGFSNLSRLKAGRTDRPPLHIDRFQVVSIETPLEELRERESGGREETRQLLRQASADVRERRGAVLARLIDAEDPARRGELLAELEEFLVSRNLEIAERAARYTDDRTTSNLVSEFRDLLDPESRRFLSSSEAVKNFAMGSLSEDFDYSLPASGLWKTVERELNLSLVWFLRIRKNVADIHSTWDAKLPPHLWVEIETERDGRVNLNRHAGYGSGRLLGLMLGDVRFMLQNGTINGIHDDLKGLGSDTAFVNRVLPYLLSSPGNSTSWVGSLPWLLKKVADIRNRHAHVEPMQRTVFENLEDLLLSPKHDPWSSHLGRILEVKRRVLSYVEQARRAAI